MKEKNHVLTLKGISRYADFLREQERAESTVKQYTCYLTALSLWLHGRPLLKSELIKWKKHLSENYASATVNAMLASVNGFLRFMGWNDAVVKLVKVQKALFCDENRELSYQDYTRLVKTAEKQGNMRLSLVIQTICSTGIRVSELRFITVEAVRKGKTEVSNKGKRRMIFLPEKLRRILKTYIQKQKITAGAVFVTRTGQPLNRSNIWRDMKALCKETDINPAKVFPHNLRHLFARKFYEQEKDACRLADILGHTSINTTRIYTTESGWRHARQIERLNLVVTTT